MLGTKPRTSIPNRDSLIRDVDQSTRPKSKDGPKKNIWSSMLDNVASGKKLPEKNIVVLGGTPESQKEFLESLSSDPSNPRLSTDRRSNKLPPIANQFALGYTYQDVLDTDQEDILARLSIYLLSDPSPSFSPLLRPLFTARSIPDTLVVILLDWGTPWSWIQQIREWIRILRLVLSSLGDEERLVMQEVMNDWKDHKRGGDASGASHSTVLPPGPGEWDEGLGVPLCVVCQGADKVDKLEKENSWREEDFDYILQFMRTVLLKRKSRSLSALYNIDSSLDGSSLVYTTPFFANSLQTLIHSSLGIHSTSKRQTLKHNVVDKDRILIPANWDSWGKIRIIRDGFDMEGIGAAWSVEIDEPPSESTQPPKNGVDGRNGENHDEDASNDNPSSTVTLYEHAVRDPRADSAASRRKTPGLEVQSIDTQEFLSIQLEVIERLKIEEERTNKARKAESMDNEPNAVVEESGRVIEHIGPVQFNMGGIQVDADDMLKRLKEQEANSTPKKEPAPAASTPQDQQKNEELKSFFQGLLNRKGTSSPRTPTAPKEFS